MKPPPNNTDDIVTKQQYKHLWILKSTGLGITEFFLRWIAWMALRNNDWRGKIMCIVTGPNIALVYNFNKTNEGTLYVIIRFTTATAKKSYSQLLYKGNSHCNKLMLD